MNRCIVFLHSPNLILILIWGCSWLYPALRVCSLLVLRKMLYWCSRPLIFLLLDSNPPGDGLYLWSVARPHLSYLSQLFFFFFPASLRFRPLVDKVPFVSGWLWISAMCTRQGVLGSCTKQDVEQFWGEKKSVGSTVNLLYMRTHTPSEVFSVSRWLAYKQIHVFTCMLYFHIHGNLFLCNPITDMYSIKPYCYLTSKL